MENSSTLKRLVEITSAAPDGSLSYTRVAAQLGVSRQRVHNLAQGHHLEHHFAASKRRGRREHVKSLSESTSQRQTRILDFLRRFLDDKGYPPTIRDIVNGCGISSTSVVDYNLKILERQGYIRRGRDISRGIELIGRGRRLARVPVIGHIAAGEPIPVPTAETWDSTTAAEVLELSEELTRGKSDLYALRVKGTSMVDALINDGDMVVMQHTNTADSGELVAVWLKDRGEVTLKRFYHEGDRIRLQPANAEMQPLYAAPENVEIQGRVAAVIRKLE